MYHIKILVSLYALLFFALPYAQAISGEDVPLEISIPKQSYDGDPFFVSVKSPELLSVTFTWDKTTLFLKPKQDGQPEYACEAMFAIPFKSKKKSIPLDIQISTQSGTIHKVKNIHVVRKKYPEQRLKVKQKYATPPDAVKDRIAKEVRLQRNTYSVISPVKYWSFPFIRPVPGEVTSAFGLRRFFNGIERNPHKGVDFDASKGDPVPASDAGIVVLTGEFYYNGNTVIIDHGLGVFTSYMHLSKITVEKGQKVSRGEIIGLVGSTGRVTGPHLHLSLYVLKNSVNAAQVLEGMLE